MSDEPTIDLRGPRFELTADERALLQTLVDRDVVDLDAIGRSLGTSDEGVYAVMSGLAEKLEEFRYLAMNCTPPLGTRATRSRRRSALRVEDATS